MSKSPQYSQQSKSKVEEICIYQNMESGRHSIYIYGTTSIFKFPTHTHPPLISSSVAIEKYLPNNPLNVADEDTLAMSPHVDEKLFRLRSFKSRKLI